MPTYLTPGVYVEEVDRGSKPLAAVGTAVAAFVGFTAKAPSDDPADPEGLRPRLVTNWSQFEKLYGGFTPGAMLPHAVYGYFNNGGGNAYIVRIAHRELPKAALTASAGDTPALDIVAKTGMDNLSVTISVGDDAPEGTFDLDVKRGDETIESFAGLTLGTAADVVNDASPNVAVATKVEDATVLPETGTFELSPSTPVPLQVTGTEFAGGEADRTGINGLVIADDVTMVAVPDLITAATLEDGSIDLELWQSVQIALINHCENQANRMAILDPPPNLSPQQVRDWRTAVMYDSKFAVMYYPWLKVANPAATNGNRTIHVPPSGHLAGIWARNDETRGVWKAPANEVVAGALDVSMLITKGEQAVLNPIGVNCIRPFGTRGIRVWGARTLSSDPSWKYVNVRRLFNMIETSIMDGTQWVVFEPNDQALWQRVKRTISAFLLGLWRDGALFGATADEAFYVKCDAETNPPDSIDQGRLITEIGISPVKPAEFVIFRISQWTGGADAAE